MQTHNRVLVPEDRPRKPGRDLMRAAYAHAKSAAAASTIAPETIAQSLWRDEVVNVLTRGASSPATTTDPLWASALARQEIGSYLTSLEPLSAGARLLNLAPRASLDGIASISFPRKAGPTAAQASWVGEFEPIPVPSFSLDSATLGPARKLCAMAVATRECVESGAGETVVSTLLREATALALDKKLFSPDPATPQAPPGLPDGVTPIPAAGAASDAALVDVGKIAASIAPHSQGPLVFVANPAQASYLALRRGFGIAADSVVRSSLACNPGVVIGLDPLALVSAFGPEPELESSRETVVHMEDSAPAAIGSPGTPTVVASPALSAWQVDVIVTRLILRAAWCWRAPNAIAWIDAASWGAP
jgi:hypothetical protein